MADHTPEHDRTASLMTPAKLAQASRSKAPVSASAWLDRMAADAGHLHVQRLAELSDVLQTHAAARRHGAVLAGMEQLREATAQLRFDGLQARGWWARTTGKGKSASAQFAAGFEPMDAAAASLAAQMEGLAGNAPAEMSATDRALVEFEVEFRALDKVVDQGARWLQDMQTQLKARKAAGADAQGQQQIRDDAARCEILMARLKLLRDAVGHAQQSHQQALAAATCRQAVARQVQACKLREWRAALAALAASVADGAATDSQVEGAAAVNSALQAALGEASAGLQELQVQEHALAESLQTLKGELRTTH